MSEKKYGLILPRKKSDSSSLGTRTLNRAFDSGDELESDGEKEESPLNWIEASLKKSAGNAAQQSTHKRMLREALQEDSTIFQYDEVYNDMKSTQNVQQAEKKEKSKPKYIATILKQAEKRKINLERLKEQKVQREREAEGDIFADKESFVTPSYLKKLEELKKAEREETLQKLLEEKNDLHKHKSFTAFYSHIYKQKMGEGVEIKQEPTDADEQTVEASENESTTTEDNKNNIFIKKEKDPHDGKSRQYRRRSTSRSPEGKKPPNTTSSAESSPSRSRSPSIRSRRKDDHSFQSRSRSPENRRKQERSRHKKSHSKKTRDRSHSNENGEAPVAKSIKKEQDSSLQSKKKISNSTQNGDSPESKAEDETPPKPQESRAQKIQRLFVKRTTGTVFDEAVARYFMRVSQRQVEAIPV